jgi:hypothetical protein
MLKPVAVIQQYEGFAVLTVVVLKSSVLWDMTSCGLLAVN